jgi:hypothetical protein
MPTSPSLSLSLSPSPSPRLTSSGACAACGAYGGSQHRPTCRPGRRFQLGRFRRARRDSRISAALRDYEDYERSLIRDL